MKWFRTVSVWCDGDVSGTCAQQVGRVVRKTRVFTVVGTVSLILLGAVSSVYANVTFYVSPGTDPSGDLPFQSALGDEFTEFTLDDRAPGEFVTSLTAAPTTITLEPAGGIFFSPGFFTYPEVMYGGTLLGLGSLTFDFSNPVSGFGFWCFDDYPDGHQFQMTVTTGGGDTLTSPILDSGNGNSYAVDGFLGAVATDGITRASVVYQYFGTDTMHEGWFELDNLQVGSPVAGVPEPSTFAIWSLFGMVGGFVAWRKCKN